MSIDPPSTSRFTDKDTGRIVKQSDGDDEYFVCNVEQVENEALYVVRRDSNPEDFLDAEVVADFTWDRNTQEIINLKFR